MRHHTLLTLGMLVIACAARALGAEPLYPGAGETGIVAGTALAKPFGAQARLRKLNEPRELKLDATFEEFAPGRNSAANEWSAYGAADGNNALNNFGRDLRVRYPAFDLVFRLRDGGREIAPGDLDSFRLGLVGGKLPAIWAGWEHGGLVYRVSVMAAPMGAQGAFDLFKVEVQNPTAGPLESKLAAGLDGPPDMRLEGDVARGLGAAPFLLADPAPAASLMTREWGLCDKRAKAYRCGGGPGKTEEAISSTRIGLDGLPVVYRVKVEPGKKYLVYVAASPTSAGSWSSRTSRATWSSSTRFRARRPRRWIGTSISAERRSRFAWVLPARTTPRGTATCGSWPAAWRIRGSSTRA